MSKAWGFQLVALMLGLGITGFLTAMLISAAMNHYVLTIWTNTIGEGDVEVLLFLGVLVVEVLGLALHLRRWREA